ncbi:MAG: helix-turn-helix transcriptional regulator [Proteobacteria bacterium]|nr:helix-turn-helix transcriptional regulator [Pseudomonadota bacterium]
MTDDGSSFGTYISAARKKLGWNQRQLADAIEREEGGTISPQYLNDIEHDRRSPSSDHMIQQFARALNLDTDHLYYLAGRWPADVRQARLSPQTVQKVMTAFRRNLPTKGKG